MNQDGEEERIRRFYEERKKTLPRGLYSHFNRANLFTIQQRERRILSLLSRRGLGDLSGLRILEMGCGAGFWLRELISWGAKASNLAGVDLIEERISQARDSLPMGVDLRAGNGAAAGFEAGRFDLVLQSTCFSSIVDKGMRQALASEIARVLKSGGGLLSYDFHVCRPSANLRPLNRGDIRALFPAWEASFETLTLLPPLARKIVPRSWLLAALAEKLPFLCGHTLAYLVKP